jgi:hypothetical protein
MQIGGFHDLLREKPSSLFMLLECSSISITLLAKTSRCMDWIIREETEINLHPNSMNREDGFSLNK